MAFLNTTRFSAIDELSQNRTIGLSIYRVVLAFLVLKNCIFYIPNATVLFGSNAIVSYQTYVATMHLYRVAYLILPFNQPAFPGLLLMFTAALAGMFLLGIWGRVTGLMLLFCIFSLNMRNEFILDGSDNVIAVTLPFLIFSNAYQFFTFSLSNKKLISVKSFFYKNILIPIMAFAVIGLMVQVCYVYFFTALHKLQGKAWLNGTAVYYTMRVQDFNATRWNIPLTQNHYFVVLGTYFTLFWELSFAFLVWFRQTKLFTLICGIILHIGIWIFMRIDNFSWIMIGSYFVFVNNQEYGTISSFFKQTSQSFIGVIRSKFKKNKQASAPGNSNVLIE